MMNTTNLKNPNFTDLVGRFEINLVLLAADEHGIGTPAPAGQGNLHGIESGHSSCR